MMTKAEKHNEAQKRYRLRNLLVCRAKSAEYNRRRRLEHGEEVRQHDRDYFAKNKVKAHARNKAFRAFKRDNKRGKHQILMVCVECGSTEKLEFHHADYSKPLDVVVLSQDCHADKKS